MHEHITLQKNNGSRLRIIEVLFISFCLMPFIIPNPVLVTNIQPYAALLGTLIVFRSGKLSFKKYSFEVLAVFTVFVAVMILLIGGVSMTALRAVYNYYAVMIIPWATIVVMRRIQVYPERLVKTLILIWFIVGSVQFFVHRGFATQIISGVRWSEDYRGVVGLASEPSFYGIACFYFLHMIQRFETKKLLYTLIVLLMGVVYAQSAMGILFMAVFFVVFLLDKAEGRRGLLIWFAAILAVIVFFVLLDTVFVGSRLHELYHSFADGGVDNLSEDVSANTRMDAITNALKDAFGNYLMPLGFMERIGSGYGGFLCELGVFALPIMVWISLAMAFTFKKKASRFLYFIGVTILLFNNTQIGNPLLLFVIGSNLAFFEKNRHLSY